MTGRDRCGDAVPAVADDESVAVAGESDRRGLATLLEPLAVPLHGHRVDRAAAGRDADVRERDPQRCRKSCVRMASLLSACGSKGVADRIRTGTDEAHDLGCSPLHHGHQETIGLQQETVLW